MKHWIRNLLVVAIALTLLGAAGMWLKNRGDSGPSAFRTAPITHSDIVATITATGTVEPEESIDIGAQVQGRIIAFGKDKNGKDVDNNSEVEEGMVLAMIDPSVYQSQVDQATAQSNNANAAVQRAEADLLQFKANLQKAQLDWNRAEKLGPSDALSQADYDMYSSAFEAAKANVEVGKAAIEQAKAQVSQAAAQLKLAKQNLGYCTITSPVKGVVITRRVNIGQIHAGQDVSFSADAFGARKFRGVVSKVRMDAQMTQNVVTYTVEITVDNGDRSLIPYLTANVNFEVNRHNSVLAVANAALRYVPQMEQISPSLRDQVQAMMSEASAGGSAEEGGSGSRRRERSSTRPTTQQSLASSRPYRERSGSAPQSRKALIWVQDGQFVKPIPVTAGLTDSKLTEISGADLSENMQVVVGEQSTQAGGASGTSAGGSNPFIPQFRRTGSGGGGGGGGGGGRGGR